MANVLIVEDDELTQTVLQDLLVEAGHEVRLARDWMTALGQLQAQVTSVMLLDVGLPGIQGDVIAELIHKRDHDHPPAVILHSALEPEILGTMAEKLGAHGFLTKGCEPAALLAAVASAHATWQG